MNVSRSNSPDNSDNASDENPQVNAVPLPPPPPPPPPPPADDPEVQDVPEPEVEPDIPEPEVDPQEATRALPPVPSPPPPPPAPEPAPEPQSFGPLGVSEPEPTWQEEPELFQQEEEPEPARKSRSRKPWGMYLLILAFLGVAAFGGYRFISDSQYSPTPIAEEYLSAITAGDVEAALEVLEIDIPESQRVLATNDIYGEIENRPTRYTLNEPTISGDVAKFTGTITQPGASDEDAETTESFELIFHAPDRSYLVFKNWQLVDSDLFSLLIYEDGPENITVNGQEIEMKPKLPDALAGTEEVEQDEDAEESEDAEDSAASEDDSSSDDAWTDEQLKKNAYIAFAGTYEFGAPGGTEYLSNGTDTTIEVKAGSFGILKLAFTQGYSGSLVEDVIADVDKRLESCLAPKVIKIDDCLVASWEDPNWEAMTKIKRSWETLPEISLVAADGSSKERFTSSKQLTESGYDGALAVEIAEGSILMDYKVRDTPSQSWTDTEWVYDPFYDAAWEFNDESTLKLPLKISEDSFTVDYDLIDTLIPGSTK